MYGASSLSKILLFVIWRGASLPEQSVECSPPAGRQPGKVLLVRAPRSRHQSFHPFCLSSVFNFFFYWRGFTSRSCASGFRFFRLSFCRLPACSIGRLLRGRSPPPDCVCVRTLCFATHRPRKPSSSSCLDRSVASLTLASGHNRADIKKKKKKKTRAAISKEKRHSVPIPPRRDSVLTSSHRSPGHPTA